MYSIIVVVVVVVVIVVVIVVVVVAVVGPPVPATVRGGAAGPGSSLSNDCESTLVGHLAGLEKNATSDDRQSTFSPALIEALRRQHLETEQRFEKSLLEVKELLAQMKNSASIQRNVNSTVKDRLPVLEEKVSELLDAKRTYGFVRNRLALFMVGPALITPSEGEKRSATSPPIPPSEWIEVIKKTKKTSSETEDKKKNIAEQPKAATLQTRPKEVLAKVDSKRKLKTTESNAIILKPTTWKPFRMYYQSVAQLSQKNSGWSWDRFGAPEQTKASSSWRKALPIIERLSPRHWRPPQIALAPWELVPKVVLEIRDLDSYSTKEEVEKALRRDLEEYGGGLLKSMITLNGREQCMETVTVEQTAAAMLMQTRQMKISCINCRICKRAVVPRFLRCLDFGHHSSGCRGSDRTRLCFRCGARERAREDKPDSRNHMAGSGTYESFREALEKAKNKWQ